MTGYNRSIQKQVPIGYESAAAGPASDPSSTWQWTLIILACLVLAGFVAGFTVRGTAIAEAKRPQMESIALNARGSANLLSATRPAIDREDLAQTFGTALSDELVALSSRPDGSATGVVKVHRANSDGSHQLRFFDLDPDGNVAEWLRRDYGDQAEQSFAFTGSGSVVIGTPMLSALRIAHVNREGETVWTRRLELVGTPSRAPDLFASGDRLIVFSPTANAETGLVMALDMSGTPIWSRRLPVSSDAHLVVTESGSILIATMTSNAERAELVALDDLGDTMWRTPLWLEPGETLAGLVSTADSKAAILVSGDANTLLMIDSQGELTNTQVISGFPRGAELKIDRLDTSDRIAISGSTLAMGDYRSLHIGVYSSNGRPVSQETVQLPAATALHLVSEIGTGQLLLSGSMRRDLFSDTDLFFQAVTLTPPAFDMPDLDATGTLVAALQPDTPVEIAVTIDGNVSLDDTANIPEGPELQRIELSRDVPEAEPDLIQVAAVEERPVDTRPAPAVRTAEPGTRTRPVITRFVEQGQQVRPVKSTGSLAQCRFTCLSKRNTSRSFPIWQTVPLQDIGDPTSLSAAHQRSCAAANGIISESEPRCIPGN